MSPLGKLEQRYQISSPPCKRCGRCDFKPTCKAYAQAGTVVELTLDRDLGQFKGPTALKSDIYDALELSIDPQTAVNAMATRNRIRTVCLDTVPVYLEPTR